MASFEEGRALGQAIAPLKRPVGLRNNNTKGYKKMKTTRKHSNYVVKNNIWVDNWSTLYIWQCNNDKSFALNTRCSKIHHVRKGYCDDINFLGKISGERSYKRLFSRGFDEKAVKHQ